MNLIKTLNFLQVFAWSHGGQWCSWWSWRWCQGTQNTPGKLYWKFHQDPTSGSLPRLHLSSKSLPGVLEDLEGPDGAGDGVGGSSIPIGTFPQSLMMIWALELWFWSDFELWVVVVVVVVVVVACLGIRLSHGLTILHFWHLQHNTQKSKR